MRSRKGIAAFIVFTLFVCCGQSGTQGCNTFFDTPSASTFAPQAPPHVKP